MSEPRPDDGADARDGEVPRLPRGPLLRLRGPELFRIGMIAILLVATIGLRRPCGDAVANFFEGFAPPPDAGPAAAPPMQLERLTEEQIKQRFPSGSADAGRSAGSR